VNPGGNPDAVLISQPPQAEIDEIIDLAVDRGQAQILERSSNHRWEEAIDHVPESEGH